MNLKSSIAVIKLAVKNLLGLAWFILVCKALVFFGVAAQEGLVARGAHPGAASLICWITSLFLLFSVFWGAKIIDSYLDWLKSW